jgi:hypothetical protein
MAVVYMMVVFCVFTQCRVFFFFSSDLSEECIVSICWTTVLLQHLPEAIQSLWKWRHSVLPKLQNK